MEAASKEAWRANSRLFRAASHLLDQATSQEVLMVFLCYFVEGLSLFTRLQEGAATAV